MGNRVPSPVIRERSRRLRDLGVEKSLAFRQKLVGRSVEALVLEDEASGLTANYVEVHFEGSTGRARSFARGRVTQADARGTRGVWEAA
jgi:tRNA A37 methylthiotransferase MiaB